MASNTNQIVTTVEGYYAKLPALPKSWRDAIVTITPWIALIFGVLGVLVSLIGVGLLTFLAPFVLLGGGVGAATGGIIGSVLALIASVLLLMAFPGTNARKLSGWNLLFWSQTVNLVAAVVSISLSGVVGVLIGYYLLFQIKAHYK